MNLDRSAPRLRASSRLASRSRRKSRSHQLHAQHLEQRMVMATQVFNNVLEANNFTLAYELAMPGDSNIAQWKDATPVPYTVNNSALIGSYDRVAYYMELQVGAGPLQYVYVSMNPISNNISQLALPHNVNNPVLFQQFVSNMNIVSNVPGIVTGTGISTGNVEFWQSNYSQGNSLPVPGASAANFDFGDTGAAIAPGHGSFQIHNYGAGQTLMAFNRWGGGNNINPTEIGLGNAPGANTDWTFAANGNTYSVKNLAILVRQTAVGPAAPTAPSASTATPALVGNAPELAQYQLVYKKTIPTGTLNFNTAGVGYDIDNSAQVPNGSFDRVAYYMQLDGNWVEVSFNANNFSSDAKKIGIPTTASGAVYKQFVQNMNVRSSNSALNASNITGNVEFWPSNYSNAATYLPNGQGSFDFDDSGFNNTNGYGSMQIHNFQAGQTVMAFNRWGNGTSDLGIGNRPAGDPDWTFADNAATYGTREIYVFVRPKASVGPATASYAPAGLTATAPELADYQLVYQKNITSVNNNYGAAGLVGYDVDNTAQIPVGSFDRIAYVLTNGVNYAVASFNSANVANDPAKLGIPTVASGEYYQQSVTGLKVTSNVATNVTNGSGNIEFWPNNYSQATSLGLAGGNGGTYDFDDRASAPTAGYGSMQIHNTAAQQTVIAYNAWGGGGNDDIGIGNQVGGNGNPDYTLSGNATLGYSMYVLVRPTSAATSGDDNIVLKRVNGLLQYTVNGTNTIVVSDTAPLTLYGLGGNDTLTIDYSGGNPIPTGGFVWDGGSGSDSLTVTGGTTTKVTHNTTSPSDGTIVLEGTFNHTITYRNLEPVNDNLNAVDRVFNFTAGGGFSTVPGMIHQWTFNDFADTTPDDKVGTANGTLLNGATVVNQSGQGYLSLDGINDFMRTSTMDETITTKTLVAWVKLNNLTQQAGSVLTLENPTGTDYFDGVVYAEQTSQQWMAGSDGFNRTQSNGSASETLTDPSEVMVAITYASNGTITFYRNGVQWGSPYIKGSLQTYPQGIADVLIGARHDDASGGSGSVGGADPFFAGLINEARIYNSALTAGQIAQVYTEGPVTGTSDGTETITLSDAAGSAMTIDSTLSESITFANPTGTLTINTLNGNDTLNVNSIDLSYTGPIAINGGNGNDAVTLNLAGFPANPGAITYNGNTGTDTFTLQGGAVTTVTHNTVSNQLGNVVTSGGVNGSFTYLGMEGVTDNINASNRVFNSLAGTSTGVPGLQNLWTFNGTTNDTIGGANGTLLGGASLVTSGTQQLLSLDGIDDYMRSSLLSTTTTTKTLIAWVRLNNTAQRSGSALTIENPAPGNIFDGIVFAEQTPQRWMAGSNGFSRTQDNGGPLEGSIDPAEVMVAITYGATNAITFYRNGIQYGNSYTQGSLQTYSAGATDVLIGVRHLDIATGGGTATGNDQYLAGLVNEARIYNQALSAAQILQLFNEGPVNGDPTGAETITLTNAGSSTLYSSTLSVPITYANPSSSLAINSGAGNDIVNVNGVGTGFAAATTIDGGAATDAVNLNAAMTLNLGGGALTVTAEAISAATVTISTTGNQTYNGPLTLTGSTLNANAASVILGGDVTTVASATQATISGTAGLNLNGTRTFTVNQGAANEDLRINAGVTNGTVIKNGTGLMTLAGAGSYAGGTQINGGTVMIQNAAAFGTNNVNIATGANILLWFNAGSNTVLNNFTLNGIAAQGEVGGNKPTIYGDGGAPNGFGEYILAGQITLNGVNNNIGGNDVNHIRINGQLTGGGGLTKGGARADERSTLTLANNTNNYAGATVVAQGTLRTAADDVIPNGSAVTVNTDRVLDLGTFNETIGSLSGDGSVIRTTRITNDADSGISPAKTYTHALDFSAGVSPVATVNGVLFTDAASVGPTWSTNATATASGAPPGASGGLAALLNDFYHGVATQTVTLSGLTAGTTYEVRIYIRTWGGPRYQTATFDHDGAGPGGTRMTFDEDSTANPAYVSYRYTAVTNGVGGALPLIMNFTATSGGPFHLYGLTNEVVTSAAVAPTLTVGDATSTTFTGTLTGPGNLVKQGTGTLTLGGSFGNNMFGTTTVNEGSLNLGKANAIAIAGPLVVGDADANVETVKLFNAEQIADNSAVTVNANGLLNLGGFSETIGSLAGNGQVIYDTVLANLTPVLFFSDADVGISTSKTYTHVLDFPAGGAAGAVINGVAFADAGLTGGNYSTNLPNTTAGNTSTQVLNASQGVHALLTDFYYNNNNEVITLTGMTPGQTYELRLYNRFWGGPRNINAIFDPDGAGPISDTLGFNQDGFSGAYYIPYRYVATASALTVTLNAVVGGTTYHNYGLSNELVSTPTLTTGDTTSTTFSGQLSGNGNLAKRGTGVFTLSGTNPYTGTTNVQAGILRVNGTDSGPGTVTVQSGATLGGNGTIGGPVNVQNGAFLTPGDNLGDLATGDLTLVGGSTYTVELNGAAPGTGYDQTVVTGAVSLSGAILAGSASIVPAAGQVFVIIANDGADPVTGFFANANAEMAPITLGGLTYHVTYKYNSATNTEGTGNDVALIRNRPPVAVAGSYTIAEGNPLSLNASGSSDLDGDTLTYRWDVDGDGDFDENIIGATPTVTWAALQLLGIDDGLNPAVPRTIRVEANDGQGGISVSTATNNFTLTNAPPTAALSGPTITGPGQPVDFTFSATDPSATDSAASFTYDIDWNGDTIVDQTVVGPGSGVVVSHAFPALGTFTVSVTATDKDGGVSLPATQNIDVVPVYQDGSGNIIAGGLDSDDRFIFSLASGGKVQVRWENAASAPGGPYPTNYGPFTLPPGAKLFAYGNGGNDTITTSVTGVPVVFDGGAGNDYLAGGNADDSLIGGDGDDRILGGIGNDFIDCGIGADSVDGGADNDTILGGAGIDTLNGSAGNDVMDGGDDRDMMNGGAGMDIMFGGGGGDTVNGAADGDVLVGGDGDDSLLGDTGRDILLGGYGKDTLTGGNDDDVLAGGFTSYDNYSPTNAAALQALLAEWGGANPYATRVANLKSGGGVTGGNRLNPGAALGGTVTVVNDDGFNDTLTGGAGTTGGVDWFLASTAVSGANKDTTDRVLSGTGAETLN